MPTKTNEQERAEFAVWAASEGYALDCMISGHYIYAVTSAAWSAWQARAALQSQDRDDVTVLKAGLEEAAQTMRAVLAQEKLKAVAKRCLSHAIGVCDKAIDHARRKLQESHNERR